MTDNYEYRFALWVMGVEDSELPPNDSKGSPFESLNEELHREIPPGHLLYGLTTTVVAVCTVTHKDFIFATNDPVQPIALVHLMGTKGTTPKWPYTTVFRTLDEWTAEMKEWNAEFPGPAHQD